jgi:AcrR family transcriptional regulator
LRGAVSRAARELRVRRAKRDVETRQRLLDSALTLFAEQGFHKVTVRDISRHARANLAAISYHFGDKLGLYAEILEEAIGAMRALNAASIAAGKALSPEDKLRAYVRAYLPRMARLEGKAALIHQLMRHEMADPTPAMSRVVEQGVMPRIHYLSAVVAELLDCGVEDERVRLCVMSVQAQCMFFVRDKLRAQVRKSWLPLGSEDLAQATEHVAEFSLAGILAMARPGSR